MSFNQLEISPDVEEKFNVIYKLHQESVHNLTSISNKDEFYLKHFLDSIYIFTIKDFNFHTVLDVGSGGGFPGIPIGLIHPDCNVYLVESIRKKGKFLEKMIDILGLKNVFVIIDRVENLTQPKCDLITSRGVSNVKNIIKWTKNVSHETSTILLYKGERVNDELKAASGLLEKKHMEYENVRIEEPIKRTYTFIYRT